MLYNRPITVAYRLIGQLHQIRLDADNNRRTRVQISNRQKFVALSAWLKG